jgi:ubiquinone/menaquinone biosynthesis C-methylase UbiE
VKAYKEEGEWYNSLGAWMCLKLMIEKENEQMSGHGHRFNPEKAGKLLSPMRKKLISPETVIDLLGLGRDDVVADLGAGNGYFTVPIAAHTDKTVYAVDIEPKMLDLLKEHASIDHVENIKYIQSNLQVIPINDAEVEKILIAFVIHEVPDRMKVYKELNRIRKSGSKIVILEWQAVESGMGPALHEKIPSDELKNELEETGFEVEILDLNETIYAALIQ